ncbi:MAG: hypothetical protein Q8M29_15940 [Bacteroidota bacterium]|nr:hypothetical protein [Bacteroidota bacterium]
MKANTIHTCNEPAGIPNIAEENEKENIIWLEKMMHFISHTIRQSVANIVGLAYLLNRTDNSPKQLNKFMKKSTLNLDKDTKELSTLVYQKLLKLKKQGLPKK